VLGRGLTRRDLIERGGTLGLAAFVAQLPGVLEAKGWLEDAYAQSGDVVVETLSGLVAFILPGDDPYSEAQGTKTDEPGGIAAGTVPVFIRNLDAFVPVAIPGVGTETLPASGGVAMLLNRYALEVNPAAGEGDAISPFARLTFDEKAQVMQLLEADTLWDDTEFKFVSGILPGFVGFLAWSEAGVIDADTREPTKRPVGWKLAKFDGPAEGHPEFRGYYRGHRSARKRRRHRA
jgi:hypothetical protein